MATATYQIISKEKIEEMVAVLAAEFGVSIPRIICHGRHSTQAFYRYWVNEIHFVGVESQEEWAVIHEFAHHLTRMTFPRQKLYTIWDGTLAPEWYTGEVLRQLYLQES